MRQIDRQIYLIYKKIYIYHIYIRISLKSDFLTLLRNPIFLRHLRKKCSENWRLIAVNTFRVSTEESWNTSECHLFSNTNKQRYNSQTHIVKALLITDNKPVIQSQSYISRRRHCRSWADVQLTVERRSINFLCTTCNSTSLVSTVTLLLDDSYEQRSLLAGNSKQKPD